MYKRILCATDFSNMSFKAVRTASALAKALRARLILLNVVVPVIAPADMFSAPLLIDWKKYEKASLELAKRRLKRVADDMVDPDVRTRSLVLSGQPAQVIDKCATREKADLIVIATHGMTGWRHYVAGSVAQKVIQHSPLPVLAVRGPKER